MNPQESARILTAIAPAALIAPPVALLAVALGVGVLWLLSDDQQPENPEPAASGSEPSGPEPASDEDMPPLTRPTSKSKPEGRKVIREDLAEALAYGARAVTRKEAVETLAALGFRKTAAYKALAEDGRFASLMTFSPDGLIEWNG